MSDRILLVDDEHQVLNAYRRTLRGRYTIDVADSAAAALQMVATQGPYAVVISDMRMPNMDGVQLLSLLRQSNPDMVRIMLTGNADQQTAVDAVNKGEVYRFLTKPCDRETLQSVIDAALREHEEKLAAKEKLARSEADIDELQERLEYETQHDVLTGLANRLSFSRELDQRLSAHAGAGTSSVLCHFDVDQLHVVNDTCGHIAGDAILRTFATLLSSIRRPSDIIGRLSGDSFAAWLDNTTIDEARLTVGKIQQAAEKILREWDGTSLDMRVSVGMVSLDRTRRAAAEWVSMAETACNVAKEGGRGQIHVAGPGDEALTDRINQSQWLSRIGRALRDSRFQLFKQKIVRLDQLDTGDHYEILIRMLDDDGNLVSPAEFLGAAEQYRLTPDIDAWVICNAVDWFERNPDELDRLALCSINLSGHSLGNPKILDLILSLFDKSNIPARKICFEITETATIAKLATAVHFIKELRAAGFHFALDDFGSGLSSFAYLKNLPVDFLKIDGIFVKDIHKDPIDFAFVRSIHEVATAMGMQTIAEFVENTEIVDCLKQIGVDYAQGFHIHRPNPLWSDTERRLREG